MRAMEKAILETLVYGDVFDYPLEKREIWKYLIDYELRITNYELRIRKLEKGLAALLKDRKIEVGSGYYFLPGREKIVELRRKREKWSKKKFKKAERIANLLKIIPTVKLVGISGALAMENVDEGDDIDLFIVASANRLWLTRFLVTVLVELIGQRRKPRQGGIPPRKNSAKEKPVGLKILNPTGWGIGEVGELARLGNWRGFSYKDKICLNMFVDKAHLTVPLSERNLFTAHEVVQMIPLWSRDDVYQRFLGENGWVREWLANSIEKSKIKNQKSKMHIKNKKERKRRWLDGYIVGWLDSLEKGLMKLQLKYMERRRTTEKISPGRILFHPEDKGEWVMREFKKRIKEY